MSDLQRAQLNVYTPEVVYCTRVGRFSSQEVTKGEKNVKKLWGSMNERFLLYFANIKHDGSC